MSELCCQTAVGLFHVHDFGVCPQNVKPPEPDSKMINGKLLISCVTE